jgi:hypothetical protein
MSDPEINEAIAKACGWWENHDPSWEEAPDYCNDLNAMHEAEVKLLNNRHTRWINHLTVIRGGEEHNTTLDLFIQTTAAQRAEALLRTIGKWK